MTPDPYFHADELATLWLHPDIREQVRFDGMPSPQEVYSTAHRYELDKDRHIITLFREGRRQVGWINLRKISPICVEMHGGFLPEFRGSYVKDCVITAIDFSIKHWDALKIYSIVPSFNRPACHLLASLGFVREGCLTNALQRDGHFYHLMYWGFNGLPIRN